MFIESACKYYIPTEKNIIVITASKEVKNPEAIILASIDF